MINLAANRLRAHDLNLTTQRQIVYAHLLGRTDHPNAEMIYRALKADYAHLSKMTVYNVLSALVEHRLVERIHIENDEMRYDAEMAFHAHFRCRKCEKIFDVYPKAAHLQSYLTIPNGFRLEDEQVVYYGLCDACAGKESQNETPKGENHDEPTN